MSPCSSRVPTVTTNATATITSTLPSGIAALSEIGKRRRHCERDDAAHARPRDHDALAPRQRRFEHLALDGLFRRLGPSAPLPKSRLSGVPGLGAPAIRILPPLFGVVLEAQHAQLLQRLPPRVGGEHEQGPDEQNCREHGQRQPDHDGRVRAGDLVEHHGELQSDVGEDEALEQEVDRLPDRLVVLAGGVVRLGRVIADVQPHRDDGEHAGAVEVLGDGVCRKRHKQPEGGAHDGVGRDHPEPVQQETGDQADSDAHHDRDGELPQPLPHRDGRARDDGGEYAHQCQGRGVVDEALAAHHVHHPARQSEFAADGGGRDGIRRADDRTEQKRAGERELRHDQPGDDADPHRSDEHEPHAQAPDVRQRAAEAHERCVEGGRVEQRRQREVEQQVPVDLDLGHEGQQRDRQRCSGDQQRCGPAAPAREPCNGNGPGQHVEQFRSHGARILPRTCTGSVALRRVLPSRATASLG